MAQSVISLTWNAEAGVEKSIMLGATNGKTFTVDWGDSVIEQKTGTGNEVAISHTYTDTKRYEVSITAGTVDCLITRFSCNNKNVISLEKKRMP